MLILSFRLTVAPVRSFVQEKCFWDADTSIPWNIVVSATVLKSDGFDNKCPICLDPLQVPRITECGHLFWYAVIGFFTAAFDDGLLSFVLQLHVYPSIYPIVREVCPSLSSVLQDSLSTGSQMCSLV